MIGRHSSRSPTAARASSRALSRCVRRRGKGAPGPRAKPGLVGRVGTLLGEHDVNISSMQVGRLHPRGEALMILTVDDAVPDEVRARIGAFADINAVRTARLGV